MKNLNIEVGTDELGNYPICPYCEKTLETVKDHRSHLKFMSNMHVFACPYCHKVLSIIAVSK